MYHFYTISKPPVHWKIYILSSQAYTGITTLTIVYTIILGSNKYLFIYNTSPIPSPWPGYVILKGDLTQYYTPDHQPLGGLLFWHPRLTIVYIYDVSFLIRTVALQAPCCFVKRLMMINHCTRLHPLCLPIPLQLITVSGNTSRSVHYV